MFFNRYTSHKLFRCTVFFVDLYILIVLRFIFKNFSGHLSFLIFQSVKRLIATFVRYEILYKKKKNVFSNYYSFCYAVGTRQVTVNNYPVVRLRSNDQCTAYLT